jgi:hypothetical protein
MVWSVALLVRDYVCTCHTVIRVHKTRSWGYLHLKHRLCRDNVLSHTWATEVLCRVDEGECPPPKVIIVLEVLGDATSNVDNSVEHGEHDVTQR